MNPPGRPSPPPTPAPSAAGPGRLGEWIDDRMNAVWVKDLRMWIHGRTFRPGFTVLVFLAVGLAVRFALASADDPRAGVNLWHLTVGVMLAVGGNLIPFFVYERYRAERDSGADELLRLSRMTPSDIVRGKLLSIGCGSLLILSALSPAFLGAYLMGGLDPAMMAYHLLGMAAALVTMPSLYVFLATLGRHLVGRVVAIGVLAWGMVGALAVAVAQPGDMPDAAYFHTARPWIQLLMVVMAAGGIARFLHVLSVARLRPTTEDRAAPPRRSLARLTLASLPMLYAGFHAAAANGQTALFRLPVETMGQRIFGTGWIAAWLFGAGVALMAADDTTDARIRHSRWTTPRECRHALFFGPGFPSLCAYTLAGTLIFVAGMAALYGLPYYFGGGEWVEASPARWLAFGAPFYVLIPGLLIHGQFVEPYGRKRYLRIPALLSLHIGVGIGLLVGGTATVLRTTGTISTDTAALLYSMSPFFWWTLSTRMTGVVLGVSGAVLALTVGLLAASVYGWMDRERKRVPPPAPTS